MSSAILYVAIVAIWACVLIPRWLRRGSAAEASESVPAPQRPGSASSPSERSGPPSASERSVFSPSADVPSSPSADPEEAYGDSPETDSDEVPELEDSPDEPSETRPASRPRMQSREESRRRMVAARRRLLLTLLALEAAAIALSVLHLAAPWVLIPPSIMLGGYLLLLREAANADAERVAREAEAAAEHARARAAARKRAREQARRAAEPAPRRRVEIPEPEPEDYDDLGGGRDYAPGLAGKYETSDDSDVIDFAQYKRAVGD